MDINGWLRRMEDDDPDPPPRSASVIAAEEEAARAKAEEEDATTDEEEEEEEEAPVPTTEPGAEAPPPPPVFWGKPPPPKSEVSWPSTPTSPSESDLSAARGTTPSIHSEPKKVPEEEEEEEEEEEWVYQSSEGTDYTCLLIGDNLPPPPTVRTHSTTSTEAWEREMDRYIILPGAARGMPGHENNIAIRAKLVDEALRYDPWLPVLTTQPEERPHSPTSSYDPGSPIAPDYVIPVPKPEGEEDEEEDGGGDADAEADPDADPDADPTPAPAPAPPSSSSSSSRTSFSGTPSASTPSRPPSPRPRIYPLPDPAIEAAHLSVLSTFGPARPSFFLLETIDADRALVKATRRAGLTVPFNRLLGYVDSCVTARRDAFVALMAAHDALREHEALWRGLEAWVTQSDRPPGGMSMRRRMRRREFRVFRELAEEMVWLRGEVKRWRGLERVARRRSARYRVRMVEAESYMLGRMGELEEVEGRVVVAEKEAREGVGGWKGVKKDIEEELAGAWGEAVSVGVERGKADRAAEVAGRLVEKAFEMNEDLRMEKAEVEVELAEVKETTFKRLVELEEMVAETAKKAEKRGEERAREKILEVLSAPRGPGVLTQAFDMLRNPGKAWGSAADPSPTSPARDSEERDSLTLEEVKRYFAGEPMSPQPTRESIQRFLTGRPRTPPPTVESLRQELSAAELKLVTQEKVVERLEDQVEQLQQSAERLQKFLSTAEEERALYLSESRKWLEIADALKTELTELKGRDKSVRQSHKPSVESLATTPSTPATKAVKPTKVPPFMQATSASVSRTKQVAPRPVNSTSRPSTSGPSIPRRASFTARSSTFPAQETAASTVQDEDDADDIHNILQKLTEFKEKEAQTHSLDQSLGAQLAESNSLRLMYQEQLVAEKERHQAFLRQMVELEDQNRAMQHEVQKKDDLLMDMARAENKMRVQAERAERRLREKAEKEVAELRAKGERDTAELRDKLETQMAEMKTKHKAKKQKLLAAAEKEKEEHTQRLTEDVEAMLGVMEQEKNEVIRAAEERWVLLQEKATEDREDLENIYLKELEVKGSMLEDMEERLKEVEDSRNDQQADWQAQRLALAAEHDQAIAALKAEYEREAEKMRAEHEQAMATLTAAHNQEVETLTAQGKREMEALEAKGKKDMEELEKRLRAEAEAELAPTKTVREVVARAYEHRLRLADVRSKQQKEKIEATLQENDKLQAENEELMDKYRQYREAHPDLPPVVPEQLEGLKDMMERAIRDGKMDDVDSLVEEAKKIIPLPGHTLLKELVIRYIHDEQKNKALNREWSELNEFSQSLDKEKDRLDKENDRLDKEHDAVVDLSQTLEQESEDIRHRSAQLHARMAELEADYRQRSSETTTKMAAFEEDCRTKMAASEEDCRIKMAAVEQDYRQRVEKLDAEIAEYDAKTAQYHNDLEQLCQDRVDLQEEQRRVEFLGIHNALDEEDNQAARQALAEQKTRLDELEREWEEGMWELERRKEELVEEKKIMRQECDAELEALTQKHKAEMENMWDSLEFIVEEKQSQRREHDAEMEEMGHMMELLVEEKGAQLQEHDAELEEMRRSLKEMLAEQKAQLDGEASELKRELDALKTRINRADDRRARMKFMLESMVESNIQRQENLVSKQLLDQAVRRENERLGHEICFCSLLQYFFPDVYDATVHGGCCGMRTEDPPVDWPRSDARPDIEANNAAAGGPTSVCHGHHGHGHISSAGASWAFLCQVLTSSVWFVFLVILQTHNLQRLLWFNLSLFVGIPLYLGRLALFGISVAWIRLHLPFRPDRRPAPPKLWLLQRPSAAGLVGVVVTTVLVLTFLSAEAVRQERTIWLRANRWRTYLVDIQDAPPYWGGWPMEVDFRLAYEPMLQWLFGGIKELMFPRKRALVEGEDRAAAAVVRWFFEGGS
ncbi:hypothetical protein QBC39DRAFT_370261 [Podospora conica]|nr:hypothetical protein QBC39DRAFT_370261 [Schizothecium conicum]